MSPHARLRSLPPEGAVSGFGRPGATDMMLKAIAYVGDAVTAAGFRLAGARVFSPLPGGETAALAKARTAARVVLLSAEAAEAIPRADLEAALAALQPLTAIVPGPSGELSAADPAERVRAQLGLER